jgi:hypothetical protein
MSGIILDRDRYVPPLASQFATRVLTNAQNPTVTDTSDRGMVIDFGTSPAAGNNVRAVLKAKTVLTTTYSIIARVRTTAMVFNNLTSGLCLYDGTKLVTFGHSDSSSVTGFNIDKWTNTTTLSVNALTGKSNKWFEWLRIDVVAGDPSLFYISDNGTDWIQILSLSMAAFLTYTHVGFCSRVNRSGGPTPVAATNQLSASVLYYSDPDIVPAV